MSQTEKTLKPDQVRLFDMQTKARLEWLCQHYGASRSQVVGLAVMMLYEELRRDDIVRLVPAEEGWWVLTDGDEEIVRCSEGIVAKFPEGFRKKLQQGMRRGTAWPMMLLYWAAAEGAVPREGESP